MTAPTNEAFAKLPKGAVESLLLPENKAKLTSILTYHVVPGRLTAADLMKTIKDGKGKAVLKTVQVEDLTVQETSRHLEVVDANGHKSMVTISDVLQSNGVIHVVDTVLTPK